jgi:hypothetical protein
LIDRWCPYAPGIRPPLEVPAFDDHPRPPF